MSRVVSISIWLCILPLVGACALEEIEGKSETICGMVVAGGPIKHADVEIYQLDPSTGEIIELEPIARTSIPTDTDGRFCIHDVSVSGTLLFLAREGELHEYWLLKPVSLWHIHLSAVVENWTGQENVTISPWTSLVYELANARYNNAENQTFYWAAANANQILYEHLIGIFPPFFDQFECMNRFDCIKVNFSASAETSSSVASERYLSTLLSLSALASSWIDSVNEDTRFNSVDLALRYLALDASDARFDGFSYDQHLAISSNALRSELVMALVEAENNKLLPMLSGRDDFFRNIETNDDPRLFRERSVLREFD